MKRILIDLDPLILTALGQSAIELHSSRSRLIRDVLYTYIAEPFALRTAPSMPPLLQSQSRHRLQRTETGVHRLVRVDERGVICDQSASDQSE